MVALLAQTPMQYYETIATAEKEAFTIYKAHKSQQKGLCNNPMEIWELFGLP